MIQKPKKEHIWICKGENSIPGIKNGVVGDYHPPTVWAKILGMEDQIINCKSEKAIMETLGLLAYKSFEKIR